MENILQDKQYTEAEKGSLLCKAYYKKETDIILFYHYAVTYQDITQKETKENQVKK